MNAAEIAGDFAALCREGRFLDAVERYYAEDVVSVEAMDFLGMGREMRGKEAVRAKNANWFSDNEVHRAEVSGPFVSPERFALVFDFDWTRRASGERVRLQEVAVYTVEAGKVVREEFLYEVVGWGGGCLEADWGSFCIADDEVVEVLALHFANVGASRACKIPVGKCTL